MNWSDERYVKTFTRDTTDWLALPWQVQGLLVLISRKVDRAGLLDLGKQGKPGLASHFGGPSVWPELEGPLQKLLDDGWLELVGTSLLIPDFIESQEAKQSDKVRQAESRSRRRDQLRAATAGLAGNREGRSQPVTSCHVASQAVTGGHAASQAVTLSLAEPCLTEPTTTNHEPPAGSSPPQKLVAVEDRTSPGPVAAGHAPSQLVTSGHGPSRPVTVGHAASLSVTPGLAVPCPAEPGTEVEPPSGSRPPKPFALEGSPPKPERKPSAQESFWVWFQAERTKRFPEALPDRRLDSRVLNAQLKEPLKLAGELALRQGALAYFGSPFARDECAPQGAFAPFIANYGRHVPRIARPAPPRDPGGRNGANFDDQDPTAFEIPTPGSPTLGPMAFEPAPFESVGVLQ